MTPCGLFKDFGSCPGEVEVSRSDLHLTGVTGCWIENRLQWQWEGQEAGRCRSQHPGKSCHQPGWGNLWGKQAERMTRSVVWSAGQRCKGSSWT